MSQTNSLPSSTTVPIDASINLNHLNIPDPGMQRLELLGREKLIFVLRYDIRLAVFFRAASFDATCFNAFEPDGPKPPVQAKKS